MASNNVILFKLHACVSSCIPSRSWMVLIVFRQRWSVAEDKHGILAVLLRQIQECRDRQNRVPRTELRRAASSQAIQVEILKQLM